MRIGVGYDIHRLEEGRPLTLGGIVIPFSKGLVGHSDADVLAHAMVDALLGAAALGDIGTHFPPEDPKYQGASSLSFLSHVQELLKSQGWQVENLDATIVAQEPRLAPHIAPMRRAIGSALGLDETKVSIKAKTPEGLDALGRGDAISAYAVALIKEGFAVSLRPDPS